jgi:pentapeptide repeat protein
MEIDIQWQPKTIRKFLVVVGIIVACTLGVALIVSIFGGYFFNWSWTGITTKTLWDWLQLLGVLAIPVVVGFGAGWFTTRQGKIADAENKANQRETALQAYIDKMSELLLHEKLRDSAEEDEVRKVARVRTLTILPRLDAKRKYHVLQFLYESGLIDKDRCIIDLSGGGSKGVYGADLDGVNLVGVTLSGASLHGVKLHNATIIAAESQ